MTNQQGAPEALRLADELAQRWGENMVCSELEAAAELRRLHAENVRLAALVEAQQPTTHVQNPAGIEHVAGDVSKNGAESNMAQQPAPSAAADPQLLKFYGVTTDAELIAAQARHIERLQAKLPQNQSFAPQRVREG